MDTFHPFWTLFQKHSLQTLCALNMRLVPVIGDGNCLFRALSHIIFGDESEYNNVRIPLYIPLNIVHMFLHFVESRDIMHSGLVAKN